jgi:hypothetical protein
MSDYPDANYAPMPTYTDTIGDSCKKPGPYTFYKGGTFCEDVVINTNLTVYGVTTTGRLVVAGEEFRPTLIETNDGSHLVLAAY